MFDKNNKTPKNKTLSFPNVTPWVQRLSPCWTIFNFSIAVENEGYAVQLFPA